MFSRVEFFSPYKKIVRLSLLLSFAFFCYSIHSQVSARIATCEASTTTPTGWSTIFSLSSSTNSMGFQSFSFPIKIICQELRRGSFTSTFIVASTSGCGTQAVPLFAFTNSISGPDNTHVQDPSIGTYPYLFCLDTLYAANSVIASQVSNCNGYGTTIFSAPLDFSTTGNTHLGAPSAYPMKRCLTMSPVQYLTVSLSSTTVGFGTLSPAQIRYATTDGLGTTTAFSATSSSFYIDAEAMGNEDYSISLIGSSLVNMLNPSKIINPIGGTPASLVAGTEKFGLQVSVSCLTLGGCSLSSSTVLFPYNTNQFAYAGGSSTPTLIASGVYDDHTNRSRGSRFYVKLGATIAADTQAGNYQTALIAVVTANF